MPPLTVVVNCNFDWFLRNFIEIQINDALCITPFLAVRNDGHDEEDGADEFGAAHDARHGLRVHRVHREEQRGNLGDGPEES